MKKMIISAYAASNVGKKRQNNEDNYFLNGQYVNSNNEISSEFTNPDKLIVSVCDGMGGEEAGEVASQIAVEAIEQYYQYLLDNDLSDASVERYVNYANELICNEITKCKKRMGTTCTLLGVKDGTVTASNIGDSRIYRYSNVVLEQISKDHTEAQSMVDSGIISAEQSMKIPEKHRLTQHLGIYPYEMVIEPYTVRFNASFGDRYLLCSDGLTDMLTDGEISEVLSKKLSLKQTVEMLISKALENGGKDNVTVAVCEIQEEETRVTNSDENEIEDEQSSITNSVNDSKQELINAFGIDESDSEPNIVIPKSDEKLQPASKKKKPNLLRLVIISVVIIALVLGAFFIGKASNKNEKESVTTTQEVKRAHTAASIFT